MTMSIVPEDPTILNPIPTTGLSVVYEHANPNADIVFVHGIQGSPYKTWTFVQPRTNRQRTPLQRLVPNLRQVSGPSRSLAHPPEGGHVFWPRDLLPLDCPETRILTFGYDSHVSKFFSGPSDQRSIFGHAKDLLYALNHRRARCPGRKLVFIAHSLGGIIVKEVLRRSQGDEDTSIQDILCSTCGVFFLGTPHRGSGFAPIGETVRRIASIAGFDTNDRNLRALKFDSFELELSREEFLKIWRAQNFTVRTFQESEGLSSIGKLSEKIVPDFSSSLDDNQERAQHLDGNHKSMCRFRGRSDPNYQKVKEELLQLLTSATLDVLNKAAAAIAGGSDLGPESKLLQSLHFPEIWSRYQQIANSTEGTCLWLSANEDFQLWMRYKVPFFWLKGKAGSGKSVITKRIFDKLTSSERTQARLVVAFFFDSGGVPLQKTIEGLFRGVFHQIFKQNKELLEEVAKSQENQFRSSDQLVPFTASQCFQMFTFALESKRWIPTTIILDALDESEEKDVRTLVQFLDQCIKRAQLKSNYLLRVFLSSRHYPHISLANCSEIWTENHNGPDISNHILRSLPMEDAHNSFVRDTLISKSSGIFLWANIVISILKRAKDQGETQGRQIQILKDVPSELENLYMQMLENLEGRERNDMFTVAKWVAFAARPVTPLELCIALALEERASVCSLDSWQVCDHFVAKDSRLRFLRGRSRGLLEFSSLNCSTCDPGAKDDPEDSTSTWEKGQKELRLEDMSTDPDSEDSSDIEDDEDETPTVRFIHESVNEFMIHRGLQTLSPSPLDPFYASCHDDMARCCLQYLQSEELTLFFKPTGDPLPTQSILTRFPFSSYAVRSLFWHLRMVESSSEGLGPFHLVGNFAQFGSRALANWTSLASVIDPSNPFLRVDHTDVLQAVAAHGLFNCVQYALQKHDSGELSLSSPSLGAALLWTLVFDHLEIAEFLLSRGANPAHLDENGKSSFHIACIKGFSQIVSQMVGKGVDVSSRNPWDWTGLHLAAAEGQVDTVGILLASGAEINAVTTEGETALLLASRCGRTAVVETLLRAGANPNLTNVHEESPRFAAEKFGHVEIVEKLRMLGGTSSGTYRVPDRSQTASPAPDFGHRSTNTTTGPGADSNGYILALRTSEVDDLPPDVRATVRRRSALGLCEFCGAWHWDDIHSSLEQVFSCGCPFQELFDTLATMPIPSMDKQQQRILNYRRYKTVCLYCSSRHHQLEACQKFEERSARPPTIRPQPAIPSDLNSRLEHQKWCRQIAQDCRTDLHELSPSLSVEHIRRVFNAKLSLPSRWEPR